MSNEQQQGVTVALSEQARHFLDTAFALALHDEFMGGPTAEEHQRIEAIRAEIDALTTGADDLRATVTRLTQELEQAKVESENWRESFVNIVQVAKDLGDVGYSVPNEVSKAIDVLCRVNEYHSAAILLRKWMATMDRVGQYRQEEGGDDE